MPTSSLQTEVIMHSIPATADELFARRQQNPRNSTFEVNYRRKKLLDFLGGLVEDPQTNNQIAEGIDGIVASLLEKNNVHTIVDSNSDEGPMRYSGDQMPKDSPIMIEAKNVGERYYRLIEKMFLKQYGDTLVASPESARATLHMIGSLFKAMEPMPLERLVGFMDGVSVAYSLASDLDFKGRPMPQKMANAAYLFGSIVPSASTVFDGRLSAYTEFVSHPIIVLMRNTVQNGYVDTLQEIIFKGVTELPAPTEVDKTAKQKGTKSFKELMVPHNVVPYRQDANLNREEYQNLIQNPDRVMRFLMEQNGMVPYTFELGGKRGTENKQVTFTGLGRFGEYPFKVTFIVPDRELQNLHQPLTQLKEHLARTAPNLGGSYEAMGKALYSLSLKPK